MNIYGISSYSRRRGTTAAYAFNNNLDDIYQSVNTIPESYILQVQIKILMRLTSVVCDKRRIHTGELYPWTESIDPFLRDCISSIMRYVYVVALTSQFPITFATSQCGSSTKIDEIGIEFLLDYELTTSK